MKTIGGKESGFFINETSKNTQEKRNSSKKMKETKNNIQELQELLSKKKENMKKSINSFQRYKELSDSG